MWPFADSLFPATGSRFELFVQLSVAVDFLHIVSMEQRSLTAEEILETVSSRFESAEAALAWYQSEPLPGFGGRTAMQLVDIGYGSEVLEFIAAVDAGIYA